MQKAEITKNRHILKIWDASSMHISIQENHYHFIVHAADSRNFSTFAVLRVLVGAGVLLLCSYVLWWGGGEKMPIPHNTIKRHYANEYVVGTSISPSLNKEIDGCQAIYKILDILTI